MAYRIAGIDVHKKMVAVVIADVDVAGTWRFERRQLGTSPTQLRGLADWLVEREVEEVVMESTAQYWRPVWEALERVWQPRMRQTEGCPRAGALHLAQAQSNEGPRGRKRDFPDAERLVKRLVAQELTLSFVPDVTQRLWRTVTRRKYQIDLQPGAAAEPTGVLARGECTSSSRVWCRICSGRVPAACCAPSRVAKRTRTPSPPSAVGGSTPRPTSCATRSAPAPICIRCTDGSWR